MKSAYELAMERLGGTRAYTDEQKAALAAIDQRYDAKDAEAQLGAEAKRKAANGDRAKLDAVQEELARDLARNRDRRETEKAAIRHATDR